MKKIHLAIDAMGAKYGGVATELIQILNAALDNPLVARITLFCSPSQRRLFKLPVSDRLIEAPRPWADMNNAVRIIWYECLLGIECHRIGADIILSSANFGRGRFSVPHITYIQQPVPFSKEALATFKSMSTAIRFRAIRWQMMRSCQRAAAVICQSSVMKDWVTDAFGLDPGKVVIIYPAPTQMIYRENSELPHSRNVQPTSLGHLLYVGSDYPYKMLDTAVSAIEMMRRRFPKAELTLTLPTNHPYASAAGVRCIGYLEAERLVQAYLDADIVVLPSLVETVGLPTLEAMSLGIPVLVADRPYAHDICEDAALFFNPLDPEDLAAKATRLLTDKALRKTLIDSGFKLVEKRRAAQPYKRIIDTVVACAQC